MRGFISAVFATVFVTLAIGISPPGKVAVAQDERPKTTIDLEWEAVEGAAGYEVELTPKSGGDKLRFKSEQSTLSEKVPADVYRLRVRSKEASSGIYGAWSGSIEVDATAKKIELLEPMELAELNADGSNRRSVEFKWSPAAGARFYILKVWSDDPTKAKEFRTPKTSLRFSVAGMKRYQWSVTFHSEKAINYATPSKTGSFLVRGPPLQKPVLDDIELPYVTQFSWSKSDGAERYETHLARHALDETEWAPYRSEPEFKDEVWKVEKLPPGAYRVEVSAHSSLRASSEKDFIEFVVKPTKEDLAKAVRSTLGLISRTPASETSSQP